MEKETSKKYEAAVAAFIKENKPKGTVVYDDLANQLATPYTLDAEAMFTWVSIFIDHADTSIFNFLDQFFHSFCIQSIR